MKDQKTVNANKNRGLAQKLRHLQNGKEYDIETIKEIYVYASRKNGVWESEYKENLKNYNDLVAKGIANGINNKPQLKFIDMTLFDDYLTDFDEKNNEY